MYEIEKCHKFVIWKKESCSKLCMKLKNALKMSYSKKPLYKYKVSKKINCALKLPGLVCIYIYIFIEKLFIWKFTTWKSNEVRKIQTFYKTQTIDDDMIIYSCLLE